MCLAAPARVISISENVATVDYGGVETKCRLDTLAEEVAVGDYVLIHTGFAIRRLSPEDGEETLRLFDELAASLEAEGAVGQASTAENPSDVTSASPAAPEPEPNAACSTVDEGPASGSGP